MIRDLLIKSTCTLLLSYCSHLLIRGHLSWKENSSVNRSRDMFSVNSIYSGQSLFSLYITFPYLNVPEFTALSCGISWRKLFLSFMFLKSQSLTVWSTEAVTISQSHRGLNSACVTLALCNLSLKI